MIEFLGSLTPEFSLYEAYLIPSREDALWCFMCLALGGLFSVLFLKKPVKE